MKLGQLVRMLGVEPRKPSDPSLNREVKVAAAEACAQKFPVGDDALSGISGWEMHGETLVIRTVRTAPSGAIKLYLLAWETRQGNQGIQVFPSKRALYDNLASWLLEYDEEEDIAEVKSLLDQKKFGEADFLIGELADSSGHRWQIVETEIDPTKYDACQLASSRQQLSVP